MQHVRAHTHTVVRTDSSKKIGRVEKARRQRDGHERRGVRRRLRADCVEPIAERALSARKRHRYRTRPQIASTLESHCSNVPADRRSSSARRIRPNITGSISKLGTERRARRASLPLVALSPMRTSAVYAAAGRVPTTWDKIRDQRRGRGQPRRNARWGPNSTFRGEGSQFPDTVRA